MKDLTQNVKSVVVDTRISTKANKEYHVLVVEFKNGYKFENFVNNEQMFILGSLAAPAGNH